MKLLDVRRLTVRYTGGGRAAVEEVCLDVADGEILALAGESGCGKTTLIRALLGLLPESASVTGSARLGERELTGRAEPDWAGVRGPEIAIVPQGAMAGLSPVHRVQAQLTEMVRLHTDLPRAAAELRAAALVDRVRLDRAVLRAFPHELSGGMRQRVAIALALAGEPRLLVADEPTTGLDAVTQRHVLALLADLCRHAAMSLLVVSHDLSGLTRYADRVAVMYAGRVAEVRGMGGIWTEALHPYTVGLLAATPSTNPAVAWGSVPGSAPPPRLIPPGCRFAPRCPIAAERCQVEEPLLRPVDDALVACHRAGDPERPSYPTVPRPKAETGKRPAIVLVAALSHTFRGRRHSVEALAGVDLEIRAAEVVGLVGESGSGKSTLARTMLGLLRPRAGRVELDGVDVTGLRRRALRRLQHRIGFVHQDPYNALHPAMRVADLVGEPLAVCRSPRADRPGRVREALEAVGLDAGDDFLSRFPAQLSGGQRQRVAIARALVAKPVLLIADEATSMLDVSTRAEIATTLRALAVERGLAVLLITHDIGEAVQSCDRITVLRAGRVVERGTPVELAHRASHAYTRELLAAARSVVSKR